MRGQEREENVFIRYYLPNVLRSFCHNPTRPCCSPEMDIKFVFIVTNIIIRVIIIIIVKMIIILFLPVHETFWGQWHLQWWPSRGGRQLLAFEHHIWSAPWSWSWVWLLLNIIIWFISGRRHDHDEYGYFWKSYLVGTMMMMMSMSAFEHHT